MTIESKPLLILQSMAYTALISRLKLDRKSKPLSEIPEIEKNLAKAEEMLDATINELENKH
ncbi:MAG: hypothetical protein HQ521_13510 [Bacteroidetes bacterium]|nr:hypothetical protein [Bacteroidota bacterium]